MNDWKKVNWKLVCDKFADKLFSFLKENNYDKFYIYSVLPNYNFDFFREFCKKYEIPYCCAHSDSEFKFSDFISSDTYFYPEKNEAIISVANRSEIFLKLIPREQYLLSHAHVLSWAFQSEIKEMAKIIGFWDDAFAVSSEPVYPDKLTSIQLEWSEKQDLLYSIVRDETDPSKNYRWNGYTANERNVIARVHAIFHKNKNKYRSCIELHEPMLQIKSL